MKITDEIKERINELYAELGVKTQVAKIIGCSPSTVSRYIIPNYISKQKRFENNFNKPVNGAELFIKSMRAGTIDLNSSTELSENEWEELKELQSKFFS